MGWEPETILTTTISQLEMAIKGKIDFVKKTNPFGSEDKVDEEEKMMNEEANPEIAAQRIIGMVKQRQRQRMRTGKKKVNK